jgi:hypothetical protein
MAWYLCTISKNEPSNWGKCKDVGLWGVPGVVKAAKEAKRGDRLLFWMGGRGYIGYGVVMEQGRVPQGRDEVPWPGGLGRWTYVIPMRVLVEAKKPVRLKFHRSVQDQTGFTAAKFQRGFAPINDEPAQRVAEEVLEQSINESPTEHGASL